MATSSTIVEDLSEEEKYLWAIISDQSGLDLAEFTWVDEEKEHDLPNAEGLTGQVDSPGSFCWRAWPFQWRWYRCFDRMQIDLCGRSLGKSMSIQLRAYAFAFNHPGQEMLLTAPELNHLELVTAPIEQHFYSTRLGSTMLLSGRSGVTHRPFQMLFRNGAKIVGRIPNKDGRGVKGSHPVWLEMDECFPAGTLVLTAEGMIPIERVTVGQSVFTHKNRWRTVTKTFDRGIRDAVKVRGQGHPGLVCTPDHKFFGAKKKKGDWEWIRSRDLTGNYWSSPEGIAALPVPEIPLAKTNRKRPIDPTDKIFLWLMGVWIAEGSSSSSIGGGPVNRTTWSVTPDEAEIVVKQLGVLGLKAANNPVQSTEHCRNVVMSHAPLARWLVDQCGKGALNKKIPLWVFGLDNESRQAVLDGIIYGDGFDDPDTRYVAGRWKVTTSSKQLSILLRLLAQAQGYYCSVYWNAPRATEIRGKAVRGSGWYQVVGNRSGQGYSQDSLRRTRVREVQPDEPQRMYDLSVDEDHSFVADGVCVSNSQDYPHPGWVELFETLKRGNENAVWRSHGVTKGVHDDFWEYTKPGSGFTVHKFTAMHRPPPYWTDEERADKIKLYHGRETDDYRRNILGEHGDANSPLFSLSRLMQCVDDNAESAYNQDEYIHYEILDSWLREAETTIEQELDLPFSHIGVPRTFWVGCDLGWTNHPTEILVFSEERLSTAEYNARKRGDLGRRKATPSSADIPILKLLLRVTLKQVASPDQRKAMMKIIQHYKPRAFSFDATGAGLPLFQEMQRDMENFPSVMTVVKGYNFSEKLLVDFDPTIEPSEWATKEEVIDETGIKRNAVDYATDQLRYLVDNGRLWLPWDHDLLNEFQGQTYKVTKTALNAYGRREYSLGSFHALDAARMMALGWAQHGIEEFVKKDDQEPILDLFLS